jgi:uncharacterized protein
MNCPIDGTELKITDRQGIEIDYCPQCRGVWLDRGELDKIIERTVPEISQPTAYRQEYDDDDRYEKRKRKPSFLGDLFDF